MDCWAVNWASASASVSVSVSASVSVSVFWGFGSCREGGREGWRAWRDGDFGE